MNIIVLNGVVQRSDEWHNWRTEDLENEICAALEETDNRVNLIHAGNPDSLYENLIKIKDSNKTMVLSLRECFNESCERVFVSDILNQLGIAFVGSEMISIERALDKDKAKVCFIRNKIPTSKYYVVNSPEEIRDGYLVFPIVAKPRSLGCSAGISIATSRKRLEEVVIELLDRFNQPVMLEEYIGDGDCREYTIDVLYNDDRRITAYAEIIIPVRDGIKLLDEKVKNDPELDKITSVSNTDLQKDLRELSLRTAEAINARDVARVDIRKHRNKLYVIEINLFPGLGQDSYLRRSAYFYDVNFKELMNMLVHSASIRYNLTPTKKMDEMSRWAYKKISGTDFRRY